MRLWTVQPLKVYAALQEKGIYICNPALSPCLAESNFSVSYDWLCNQMEKQIGNRPSNVKYPVWGWHTLYGRHEKPDLRMSEFRFFHEESVCIEIEVNDEEVLLSN